MASQRKNTPGNQTTDGAGTRLRSQTAPAATRPGSKSTGQGAKTAPGTARPATAAHVQPRRAERRPEMIRQRREERRQAFERQRRQWLLTRIGLIAFGVLVVAGIGYGIFGWIQNRRPSEAPAGTVSYQYGTGQDHTEGPVTYAEVPPVGGPHNPVAQNCGVYEQPVPNENAVHSLEHGAVWITYQPELPPDQVDKLRELAEDEPEVLVSPYPGLPKPVVASAWDHQLQLESADDERLDTFIRYFQNSPDAPEDAACAGTGTPM